MLRVIPIFLIMMTTLSRESLPNDAHTPVVFADANLKLIVASRLNIQEPTVWDMRSLISLEQRGMIGPDVNDLSGLQHAVNLKKLCLYGRRSKKGIPNLAPLAGLTQLEELELPFHQITDIKILGTLPSLIKLDLRNNQIKDMSALQNLTTLTWLNLRDNPIEDSVYDTQLSAIRNNNPSLDHLYDRFRLSQLIPQGILTGVLIALGIRLIYKTYRATYLLAMTVVAILSCITGGFLGAGAQILYQFPQIFAPYQPASMVIVPTFMGIAWGAVFGALIGAAYVTTIGYLQIREGSKNVSPTACGMGAGVLCSTLVHAMLMISYRETDFRIMLIGAVFGLIAGAIFGLITGLTYFKYKAHDIAMKAETNENPSD
jgi:hypothetical protein